MLRTLYSVLAILLMFTSGALYAQTGAGTLRGKVLDKQTGEPLPFANVVVLAGQTQVGGSSTDFDGQYTIKPISPGQYNVKVVFVGYNPQVISNVVIQGDKITFQDIKLESGVNLDEVLVVDYVKPLIDRDGGASGGTVSRADIDKMSARSATAVASTVGGISDAGNAEGEVSIRGARSENTFYYIDGIKVRGEPNLPKSGIEEVSVITGGIPANYGDATGGIISITTRGASSEFFGGIDLLSSGFRAGDDIIGLDAYGRTQLEGFFSGPLAWRKDSEGNKTKPLLGFFLSGNFRRFEDQRPSATGHWYLTEEAEERLGARPQEIIQFDDNVATIFNAQSLTADDFVNEKAARNAGLTGGSLTGKLDFNLNENATISVGATGAYRLSNNFNFTSQLLNYASNGETERLDWRGFARFTQRFQSSEESKLKNAFYTLSVDYNQTLSEFRDPTHRDNFFNYGHVGKFDIRRANSLAFDPELGLLVQTGDSVLITGFEPGTSNPILATATDQYIGILLQERSTLNLETDIRANALANGDAFGSVFGLFSNIGSPDAGRDGNRYLDFDNNQFRVTSSGSADIGDHAISIGMEYEQRTDRFFQMDAVSMWQRMRLLANSHINPIDPDSPRILAPNDPENPSPGSYVQVFDPLVTSGSQTSFDRNMRIALGLDPDGDDFLNVDAIGPEFYSMDMFSAQDLLQGGANLVNYSGYDHRGNKTSSDPSIDDYFNGVDEFGNATREIAPFRPVYLAGYIMDKFAFDDIIFNVGVRVDRFDANQQVLKDEYIVGDAFTAGEIDFDEFPSDRPENITDEHAVYVNTDAGNPAAIRGYRLGDDWFDATGQQVIPSQVNVGVSSFPYLKDEDGYRVQDGLNSNAFKDYDPVINVMPRVAFSFPISDEAVFFAHYDVLTQRPTTGVRLELIDYQFIQAQNNIINNAGLLPTRTIDYELGFQQALSRSSALKISAFYRDMQDMIQVRNLEGAWPERYTTYRNIDFGTVKGITLDYDLRRTGNIRMNANYTLQFADGTGSNSTGALNLASSGQPNLLTINPLDFDQRHAINVTLDYRYGEGSDYNGPIWFGKQVLANTGANFIANLGSGTPYSAVREANVITANNSAGLEGTLNGARLPSVFTLNAQFDKNISLAFGKDEEGVKKKSANLNIYLLINNLLNAQNIRSVYPFSGSPTDDGFLATEEAQDILRTVPNPQSYEELYRLRLANPFFFAQARTISLGVKLDF